MREYAMEARNAAVIRGILQNPDTGKRFLVAANREDFRYRSNGFTGKQQPIKMQMWIELNASDQFIEQGIEITDGVLSKTFAPIPDDLNIYRCLSRSGKVVFALLDGDVYVDILTETPLTEFDVDEDR